jgi:putative membrane protein
VESGPDLLTSWSPNLLQVVPALVVGVLYRRRTRSLSLRGTSTPAWRRASFYCGLGLVLLALVSPLEAFAEEQFFFMHMIQHIILGDLAPLALVAGLTGPVLRPVLALPGIGWLRVLVHPLVALPLWALNLCVWHLAVLYEGALAHASVHALEHLCFFTAGAIMWAAVLEPLPGPEWFGTGAKLGYIAAVRVLETVLGNVFIWSGTVFYSTYEEAPNRWGIGPLADQGIAGSIMMIEGSLVTIGALAWLFLRLASEGELRQELIEQGLDARAVGRAVRYGRGQELSRPR